MKQRDYDYARFSEAKRGVIDESKSVMVERDRAEKAEVRLREYEKALQRIDYYAENLHRARDIARDALAASGGREA